MQLFLHIFFCLFFSFCCLFIIIFFDACQIHRYSQHKRFVLLLNNQQIFLKTFTYYITYISQQKNEQLILQFKDPFTISAMNYFFNSSSLPLALFCCLRQIQSFPTLRRTEKSNSAFKTESSILFLKTQVGKIRVYEMKLNFFSFECRLCDIQL